jgi:hypothetical protein
MHITNNPSSTHRVHDTKAPHFSGWFMHWLDALPVSTPNKIGLTDQIRHSTNCSLA